MRAGYAAGIDIGSVSIALVLLDHRGVIVHREYRPHAGDIAGLLAELLAELPAGPIASFGVVAEKGREHFTAGVEVNEQVALIAGARRQLPDVRSIIAIGGETFCLILLDEQGRYRKCITNSACAAGTGSFLDQQASRLGLRGSDELSRLAEQWPGEPPKLATRCAVFAKTDLVHIQQQGYGLPAIAAGLCRGVARNIADTLFHGVELAEPIAVAGGVSRNVRVVACLQEILARPLTALPDGELACAMGAALLAAQKTTGTEVPMRELAVRQPRARSYHYAPLSETQVQVPDFAGWQSAVRDGVEIEVYPPLAAGANVDCYLGIDVGSTSTKAAIVDTTGQVQVGLYTRTGGQPVAAVQALTRALAGLQAQHAVTFAIRGTATTGAGRKFIQRIARADFCVDEITAHARAASHLDPAIDTIIEIGGQDAKFTVLHRGSVTFAVMNHVCAAGTGSFIDEQARRLGVPLAEFAELALSAPAPLISDRCTVFMERDINQLLALGYSRAELAAAALHSVRDNYLSKVAHLNKIGGHIAFQGATAKNHALVRAFAQRLGKPVHVSRFCHLTGALGACLKLADGGARLATRFRLGLHDEQVKVDEYVCEYCGNHCKIKCTTLDGETLGWGYLCGRDEQDAGYRVRAASRFDLLRDHRHVFAMPERPDELAARREVSLFAEFSQGGLSAVVRSPSFSLERLRNRIQFNFLEMRAELFSSGVTARRDEGATAPRIGLPATMTMLEWLPLWQLFFRRLGFVPVTPAAGPELVTRGKELCAAEYCAPLMDFHGHIRDLAPRTDYIFYPQFIECLQIGDRKSFCYYTNYAVPLLCAVPGLDLAGRLLAPVVTMDGNIGEIARQVYLCLPDGLKAQAPYDRVEEAFALAWDWFTGRQAALRELYRDQAGATRDVNVVLLGRPYLVLNPALNKRIPDQLAALGVQTFFMDMLTVTGEMLDGVRDFLAWNHWEYGDRIIRATATAAQTDGLFPVYLTAFKCSPDSFVLSYFRAIMDYYRKPYLVLQLDEHEAAEGYETRLEAAVETFRNHRADAGRGRRPAITLAREFTDRTYLLPSYDPLSARLMQGAFLAAGRKAMLIEQTPETLQAALAINDGQCLPVSILAQGINHTVRLHGLDPARTALFSPTDAPLACNLPQYPVMIKQLLEQLGGGLEQVEILVSGFVPMEAPLQWKYEIYLAYLLAGLVQKMTHRIRPRETRAGATDAVHRAAVDRLFDCFASGGAKEAVLAGIVADFRAIAVCERELPLVGIVGDVFVRDNEIMNRNLVAEIEGAGAEAMSIPFCDALDLIAEGHFRNQWNDGRYLDLLQDKMAYNALQLFSGRLAALAEPVLGARPPFSGDPAALLERYAFTVRHAGETAENLLKIFYLKENYPRLKLVVNVNPIFCCPGLISEGLYRKVEQDIGLPIVSITYDGSQADKNRVLRPYLHFLH